MGLGHSNNMKVVLRKFAKDHCLFQHWAMLIKYLFLVLILSIWLTIKPNNLRKFYSRISEKHDQTSIFAEGVL